VQGETELSLKRRRGGVESAQLTIINEKRKLGVAQQGPRFATAMCEEVL